MHFGDGSHIKVRHPEGFRHLLASDPRTSIRVTAPYISHRQQEPQGQDIGNMPFEMVLYFEKLNPLETAMYIHLPHPQ